MQIVNTLAYDPQKGLIRKDIFIKDDRISDISEDSLIMDGRDLYVLPGLCDLHFHGANGDDFMDGNDDTLEKLAHYEAYNGITSICPATMTLDPNSISKAMKTASNYKPSAMAASFEGIYMEGPFIAKERCGAQDPKFIVKPSDELFNKLQENSGNHIKICTVAPEVSGAVDFIKAMHDKVRISIAHTACNYEQASEAFRSGARELTHLYNAMPALLSRAPGPIAAGMDYLSDAELICDGIHVHEAAVRAAFKLFDADHILMISDSMRATGLSDGIYTLGGQEVKVKGNKATLADGTIAGSVTNLFDCFRHAVLKMRIPLLDAIKASAVNPRRVLNCLPKNGLFSEGSEASLVILGKWLDIKAVILRGKIIRGKDFIQTRLLNDKNLKHVF